MYKSNLTYDEKNAIMRATFNKNHSNTILNVGKYLAENYNRIDGFDYRWNSLITSNPLLFEDLDYIRVKKNIDNIITDTEKQLYKERKIRELYPNFETLLMLNLSYYERIMCYSTMVTLNYVRISDEDITTEHLNNVPLEIDITPTRIGCCALTSINSTIHELEYGWNVKNLITIENKSPLEANWHILYKNETFKKFVDYRNYINSEISFRATFTKDLTTNQKLSRICAKFTKTSTALSEYQLDTIGEYSFEQERINYNLYNALYKSLNVMFKNDDTQFAIYIYSNEFFIHSSKFSIKVSKDVNGNIKKDYLANSYECFIAEQGLIDSIKAQIEWAKYTLPNRYVYDKQILTSLLENMLNQDFRNIVCLKRMNEFGVASKIRFTGVFKNVYCIEEMYIDGRLIKTSQVCFSKKNAAQYVIERGYYIFGLEIDVYKMIDVTKRTIIEHYSNYCIPVKQHMKDVITYYTEIKNDIVNVACTGNINPGKINNRNIKFTNIKKVDNRQIMNAIAKKQVGIIDRNRKSYWKVINDS